MRGRTSRRLLAALLCPLLAGLACAALLGLAADDSPALSQTGLASWYADSLHGRSTASGEPYDRERLTAAHPKLPFGSIVQVTRLSNQRSVRVRINDRGPFVSGRIIDLSRAAAERLGMLQAGEARVTLELIRLPGDENAPDGGGE